MNAEGPNTSRSTGSALAMLGTENATAEAAATPRILRDTMMTATREAVEGVRRIGVEGGDVAFKET